MPTRTTHIATRRYQCRHIFTDGHRCGSPSLRNEDFCYYHHSTRRPKPVTTRQSLTDPYNNPPNQTTLILPIPEDASAVQLSIGQIMSGLASNTLDPRRAGLLLYALQIASLNLKYTPELRPDDIVRDITLDPTVGPLAPRNELPADKAHRELLASLQDENDEEEEEEEEENDAGEYEGEIEDTEDFEDDASEADQGEAFEQKGSCRLSPRQR